MCTKHWTIPLYESHEQECGHCHQVTSVCSCGRGVLPLGIICIVFTFHEHRHHALCAKSFSLDCSITPETAYDSGQANASEQHSCAKRCNTTTKVISTSNGTVCVASLGIGAYLTFKQMKQGTVLISLAAPGHDRLSASKSYVPSTTGSQL
jgi:hypothetical protein